SVPRDLLALPTVRSSVLRRFDILERVDRAAGDQVVTGDDGDADRPAAQALSQGADRVGRAARIGGAEIADDADAVLEAQRQDRLDRKSTRLNSSHVKNSY